MKTKEIKNHKMNDFTYKLRRQVINILYEARNRGIKLPRVNVRIGESTHKYPNVFFRFREFCPQQTNCSFQPCRTARGCYLHR